jgi:AGCS family alanine or glycine:cation symporter
LKFLETIYCFVWGIPALILILGVGLWLSVQTGFIQIRWLPKALARFFSQLSQKNDKGDVSPFRALCTALAATVGTGNLAGVAGAIAIGGPGAIFWMWICGFLGMVIKFAEATLAVHFRRRSAAGEWVGGPMYMIKNGLPKKFCFLASAYSLFGLVAAFGVGNATQISTMVAGINEMLPLFGLQASGNGNFLMGILLAAVIGFMLLGGAKRIGQTAELLVPFAAGLYLLLGIFVLIFRLDAIPAAFAAIFRGAFDPSAVTGGAVGSMMLALRTGVSRGVFTNEAGMGTASMAHASAEVDHPTEQGLMGIVEVFLDTIVICTMTALVILCSGVPIRYGSDIGIELTAVAFSSVLGNWVTIVIAFALCLFAFATVLGWGLYGIRCAQYLFGEKNWKFFVYFQITAVVLGAVVDSDSVWMAAEILNGLMAIPNLIALFALTPVLQRLVLQKKYGGHHESLDQCQSLRIFPYAYVPSLGRCSKGSRQDDLPSEHRSA